MDEPEVVRLCVLGAGSVRCSPSVIGSLATFFGERPLEVRFWDSDSERLDLFDRFARLCFAFNKCDHRLISTEDAEESLDQADRVLITVGWNCARKMSVGDEPPCEEGVLRSAVGNLAARFGEDVEVLSLIHVHDEGWRHIDWPSEPSEAERRALPHRILRFLHGDEYLHEFLTGFKSSPLKAWLNDPHAALRP